MRRARVPDVLWAERKDKIFITIEVPDCKDAKVDITEEGKLTFSGKGGTDNAPYACELQLMKPVDSKARGRPPASPVKLPADWRAPGPIPSLESTESNGCRRTRRTEPARRRARWLSSLDI